MRSRRGFLRTLLGGAAAVVHFALAPRAAGSKRAGDAAARVRMTAGRISRVDYPGYVVTAVYEYDPEGRLFRVTEFDGDC